MHNCCSSYFIYFYFMEFNCMIQLIQLIHTTHPPWSKKVSNRFLLIIRVSRLTDRLHSLSSHECRQLLISIHSYTHHMFDIYCTSNVVVFSSVIQLLHCTVLSLGVFGCYRSRSTRIYRERWCSRESQLVNHNWHLSRTVQDNTVQ